MQCEGVLEYWSTGVLGLKAEKYLIDSSFTLAFPRSKHGSYFSIIPTIHHSITPSLSPSRRVYEPEANTPVLLMLLTASFN
jgi:hypothetical protein